MGYTSKFAQDELSKSLNSGRDADSDSSTFSKGKKIKIKPTASSKVPRKAHPLKGGKRGNLGARYQEIR